MRRLFLGSCMVAALASAAVAQEAAAQEKVTIVPSSNVINPTNAVVEMAVPNLLGYFKEEGLSVEMLQGNGPSVAAQIVQSGSADFGETMPEAVLRTREQGGDVVAVYTLTQDNGVAVAVAENSPIRTLEDLKGKTIGALSWASGGGALLKTSLSEIGIKENEYAQVVTPPGPATAVSIRSGNVDALALWMSAYAAMENAGMKFRYIDVPAGHRVAPLVLATTQRMIERKPQVVLGMCRAINKAFLFTRTNMDAAVDLFLKQYPQFLQNERGEAVARQQTKHVLEVWMSTAVKDVPVEGPGGAFQLDRWEYSQKYYADGRDFKGTGKAADGYTEQFQKECNDFDRQAIIEAAKNYKM